MYKYLDGAIVFTSICSVSLASISIAETKIYQPSSSLVKNIQLQRLNNSLTAGNRRRATNRSRPLEQASPALVRKTREIYQVAPLQVPSKGSKSVTINLDIDASNSTLKPEPPLVSDIAINLIKEFEGFESQAYIDTDGTPVIGYGLSKIAGKPVQVGDRISPERADAALKSHLQEINRELAQIVKVQLNDRQKSALASIAFNVGVNGIKNSTLIKKINNHDFTGAANEFLRWDKANMRGRLVQMPGLTRRRTAERQLFLDRSS